VELHLDEEWPLEDEEECPLEDEEVWELLRKQLSNEEVEVWELLSSEPLKGEGFIKLLIKEEIMVISMQCKWLLLSTFKKMKLLQMESEKEVEFIWKEKI